MYNLKKGQFFQQWIIYIQYSIIYVGFAEIKIVLSDLCLRVLGVVTNFTTEFIYLST